MNIIIVSESGQNAKSFKLSAVFVFIISLITLVASLFYIYLSHLTNISHLTNNPHSQNDTVALKLIQEQKTEISNLHAETTQLQINVDNQLDNYVLKLAQMQSKLIHLDELGEKIVKVSHLSPKEFDFNKSYPIGGPDSISLESSEKIDIEQRFSEIFKELQIKSQQLAAIEALYDEQSYKKAVTPTGKPAENSWISSYFGKRKDPFTGKQRQHKGIDVAGKSNSKIIATASGIITWADKRNGYGNMVEISHGNGLVTRYGHCKKILVTIGQKINQGDTIATLGSTGRSTGPHVHYEVLKNGIKTNPVKYVRKKRDPALAML